MYWACSEIKMNLLEGKQEQKEQKEQKDCIEMMEE
jgi:hypothetical protein